MLFSILFFKKKILTETYEIDFPITQQWLETGYFKGHLWSCAGRLHDLALGTRPRLSLYFFSQALRVLYANGGALLFLLLLFLTFWLTGENVELF